MIISTDRLYKTWILRKYLILWRTKFVLYFRSLAEVCNLPKHLAKHHKHKRHRKSRERRAERDKHNKKKNSLTFRHHRSRELARRTHNYVRAKRLQRHKQKLLKARSRQAVKVHKVAPFNRSLSNSEDSEDSRVAVFIKHSSDALPTKG